MAADKHSQSSLRSNLQSKATSHARGLLLRPLAAALCLAGLASPAGAVEYTWFGGSGSWDNSLNWIVPGVPGIGDRAIFNAGVATLPGARTVSRLTMNGGGLSAGSLTVDTLAEFLGNGSRLLTSNAVVSTGAGSVTTWTGNTANGGNVIEFSGNATINNAGTWNDSNAFDTNLGFGNSGTKTFNNSGIYNKLSGGNTVIYATMANTGAVNVGGGRLSLVTGTSSSGAFSVAAGSTLSFGNGANSSGTAVFSAAQLSGTGRLLIDASNNSGTDVQINGVGSHAGLLQVDNGEVAIGGTFTVPALVQTGGLISGTGTLVVNGLHTMTSGNFTGTGTTQFNGGLLISDGTRVFSGGRVMNTPAGTTTTWTGNTANGGNVIEFSGNATINNAGTWNDSNAFDTNLGFGNSGTKTFNNSGIYNKLSGGNTVIYATMANTGAVNVGGGRLSLVTGTSSSGAFSVAAGSTLSFGNGANSSGTAVFSAAQLSGTGRLLIDASNNSGTDVQINGVGSHAGLLQVDNGEVAIGGTFTVPALVQTGGLISGTGTLVVNGLHTMTSGNFTGTGTTQFNGGLLISDGTRVFSGGRVMNTPAGTTTTWTGNTANGGNVIEFSGNATINNAGTWNDSNAFDTNLGFGNSGTKTFNNSGIYNKLSGGNTVIYATMANTGAVNVGGGRLSLVTGTSSSGAFSVAAGSTLSFGNGANSSGTAVFSAAQLSGTGRLLIDASNNSGTDVQINGVGSHAGLLQVDNGEVAIGGTFTVPALVQTGGLISGTGTLVVNGLHTMTSGNFTGTGTTQFNGGLLISDGTRVFSGGRVMNTPAGTTTTWTGNTANGGNVIEFSGNATVNNAGTWNDSNAFDTNLGFGNSGTKTFNNSGIYNKLSGGNTVIYATMANTGAVNVAGGRLSLVTGTSSSGAFSVAAGSTLSFGNGANSSGTAVFSAAQLSGTGRLLIDASNNSGTDVQINGVGSHAGLLQVDNGEVAIGGTFTVPALVQTGGLISGTGTLVVNGLHTMTSGNFTGTGTTQFNGGLLISDGTRVFSGGRVMNTPAGTTTTWTGNTANGGNVIEFSGNATINNAGTWNDSNAFDTNLGFGNSGTKTFNNSGIYNKLSGGNTVIYATMANTGAVNVGAGTLTLNNPTNNQGQVSVASNAVLFGNDSSFINSGTMRGNGTIRSAPNAGLTNAGTIAPGSGIGTLTLDGDLTMASAGRLQFELGSTTSFDQLVITDDATFAGTIEVVSVGYTPVLGDSFKVITLDQRLTTSTFGGLSLVGFGQGVSFGVTYNLHDVTLTVTAAAVPEPGTWALMLAGALGVMQIARRRSRAQAVDAAASN